MTKNATPVTPVDQSSTVQPTVPNSGAVIPTETKKKVPTRTKVYENHGEHDFKK